MLPEKSLSTSIRPGAPNNTIKLEHTWVETERTDRRGKGTRSTGNAYRSNTKLLNTFLFKGNHVSVEAFKVVKAINYGFEIGLDNLNTMVKGKVAGWSVNTQHPPRHITSCAAHLNRGL